MATTEFAPATTSAEAATAEVAPARTFADIFKPKRRGTSHRTEFFAGLTTFVTMAYIIAVNAGILSHPDPTHSTGLNFDALVIGTILAAAIPTLIMGLWADLPWALAPGMGYNVLFAENVIVQHHFPVGAALALVLLDGLAFLLIVAGPWRESIIKGIPMPIKLAAGAGIGLFIALIGFVNSGIVSISNSGLALGSLGNPAVIVTFAGLLLTGLLLAYRVRAALLIGVLGTTALSWAVSLLRPATRTALLPFNPTNPHGLGDFLALPNIAVFLHQRGLIDFGSLFSGKLSFGTILLFFLTFLVTDMMDSLGTFSGLATKLGILDKVGNFPRSGRALVVDAAAGMWGPVTGNATVATFIESASGVGEGGKTGLTAVWVAVFFLLSLFLVPFIGLIPPAATAPALIIVGYLMIEPVVKIGFSDPTEGIPAFLAILTMPVAYSIADGMFVGIVSYVVLKVGTGRIKQVSWVMWIFAILLILAKVLEAANL